MTVSCFTTVIVFIILYCVYLHMCLLSKWWIPWNNKGFFIFLYSLPMNVLRNGRWFKKLSNSWVLNKNTMRWEYGRLAFFFPLGLRQWFSKRGLWTCSTNSIWECVRKARSQDLLYPSPQDLLNKKLWEWEFQNYCSKEMVLSWAQCLVAIVLLPKSKRWSRWS